MCAKLQTRSPPRGYICENTLNAGPATNLREHLENSVARPRSWLFRATSPAFPFRAALRSTRVAYIAVLSACDLHLLSLLAADSSHPPGVQPLCKCDPLCSQSSIIESHTAWYEAGVDGGEGAGTEGEHNAGAEGEHLYNGGSEGGRRRRARTQFRHSRSTTTTTTIPSLINDTEGGEKEWNGGLKGRETVGTWLLAISRAAPPVATDTKLER